MNCRPRVPALRSVARAMGALVLALVAGPIACTPAPVGAGGPDRTDGMAVRMLVERSAGSAAYYVLRTDGTLGWGGGTDALERRVTWTGELTDEELEAVRRVLNTTDWFDRPPVGDGEPPDLRQDVAVWAAGAHVRSRIEGDDERVAALREILESAAFRRNEEFLRRLPEPSVESTVDRP